MYVLDDHFAGEAAVHRVEAQEMSIGLDRAEIIDGDHNDVLTLAFHDGAQHVAANAAEPIDGNSELDIFFFFRLGCSTAKSGHGLLN